MRHGPIESLGLAGDGDDSAVIRDLEHAFGVDFGDRPGVWETVGDVEADLLALYPAAEAAGLCGSAMAFRRLRAALPPAARRARPGTSLTSLVPGAASRRTDEGFRRDGLFVAASQGGHAVGLGLLTGLAGLLLLAPLALLHHGWIAAALMAAGVALIAVDRGAPRNTTLGEVARKTAAMNFAHFAARGTDRRRAAIFDAVCRILSAGSGVDVSRIGRETRLLG